MEENWSEYGNRSNIGKFFCVIGTIDIELVELCIIGQSSEFPRETKWQFK
jgi:hypothetical protein